jgi:hypothetical protein
MIKPPVTGRLGSARDRRFVKAEEGTCVFWAFCLFKLVYGLACDLITDVQIVSILASNLIPKWGFGLVV